MSETVACPSCGKSLKASRGAVGRKVRCPSCGESFTLTDPTGTEDPGLSSEFPLTPPRVTRDNTLSRSMIPGAAAAVVPQDELLGRIEPGTLRWLNATEALEDFLGQTIAQLRGRRFPESLHPDDRALAEDEFRKAVERGERHDFVLRFPEPAGRIRYVRVYTQARYNPDGTLNHIRCYLKDVTERVQAEEELRRRTEQLTTANEQLRESNRKLKEAQGQLVHTEKLASLGTLAAGMAHEINNPLAYAMNNVAVLGREVGDLLRVLGLYQSGLEELRGVNPSLADRIEQLQDDVELSYVQTNLPRMTESTRQGLQRVAKIVENLRGFAQLDRLEIALIDVNESLDQSLAMLAGPIAQHRVAVERRFEPLPLLECSAAPMNQVFLNLLMNAVQAIASTGRETGVVRVATRAGGGEIVVEVADDGVGIPAAVLPLVFDPFFTTKPIGQGTGLGLSISHGIVAEHGGRIMVESKVGQGSTFRVHLPLDRSRKRA
jgi:two-component system, NtrC family, sensor kinase